MHQGVVSSNDKNYISLKDEVFNATYLEKCQRPLQSGVFSIVVYLSDILCVCYCIITGIYHVVFYINNIMI